MSEQKNIVVIGGGFAGTTLARDLDGHLPPGYQLLLISEDSYTTFNPLLAEAVDASIFPEQVAAPIREMLVRGRFIMARVTAIDTAARKVTCASLAGDLHIDYEHLVIAIGNRARLDLIPGLADHAMPLKTVGDAMHIRNVVFSGIPLTGIAGWLLWRAYYLSQMPTLGRKLRIFVEWTWGMFFPADITHLRFTRSHQLADKAG
jgi:NADH dehydrogenase FAD-containing subunit